MVEPPELDDLARRAIAAERVARLTPNQLEVLRLVAQHMNSKEIGAALGISSHTVDQRIRGAIRLLGVARRQEAARLVAQAEPQPSAISGQDPAAPAPAAHASAERESYQRLIHQSPHIDPAPLSPETEGAISFQIRHADRTGRGGSADLETEQGPAEYRPSLVLPWATRRNPRNEMSVGQRLLWIVGIAIAASFSAGMYLAGLESLARLAGS